MKHAQGVSWLIQQRGPSAYKNHWDKAMLFSFRGIIVSALAYMFIYISAL